MNEYFSKPKTSGVKVKVELNLSDKITKKALKMQQELIHYVLLKKLI